MYIISSNNIITMNRGDSAIFPVHLIKGTFPRWTACDLEEGDYAYFAVMLPKQHFEDAIIKKELTVNDYNSEGELEVIFYPEDTIELEPGTYYYEVKMVYLDSEGMVHSDTVTQKTKFIIID